MIRKNTIRHISLTMIICSVLISLSFIFCSAAGSSTQYYSSSDGHFFSVNCDSRAYSIVSIGSDMKEKIIASETAVPDRIICTPEMLLISSSNSYTYNIIVYNLNTWSETCVMLQRHEINTSSLCADRFCNIYALSPGAGNKILKFNKKGRLIREIPLTDTVHSLFSDPDGTNIYAITSRGVFDTENGTYLNSVLPSGNIHFTGGYYSDDTGNIYSFDRQSGFRLFLSSGYSKICYANNGFYAADKNRILFLSVTGELLSYTDTEMNIEKIISSANNVAFVSSGKLFFLDKSSMVSPDSIPDPEEESSVSEESISHTTNADQSVTSRPSAGKKTDSSKIPDYRISSATLDIRNGVITGIVPGSTFAKIKQLISYGDNEVTAIDKNGNEKRSGVLGTGAKLVFRGGGNIRSFTLVVKGDITGEGNVNSKDYNALADYLLSSDSPDSIHTMAADINGDGKVVLSDFYSIYSV